MPGSPATRYRRGCPASASPRPSRRVASSRLRPISGDVPAPKSDPIRIPSMLRWTVPEGGRSCDGPGEPGGAMADSYKLVIGGDLHDAATGETFESIDPSTGETFA